MKTTTIEWFKPEEKMPRDGTEKVIVFIKYDYIEDWVIVVTYSDKKKLFNTINGRVDTNNSIEVDYWAYVPDMSCEVEK